MDGKAIQRPRVFLRRPVCWVGFPYLACLSIRSCAPLFLQTTELYQPEKNVGCAPDQDFRTTWVLQGSTPLVGLPDWALSSVDYCGLLMLVFFAACLRVLG